MLDLVEVAVAKLERLAWVCHSTIQQICVRHRPRQCCTKAAVGALQVEMMVGLFHKNICSGRLGPVGARTAAVSQAAASLLAVVSTFFRP